MSAFVEGLVTIILAIVGLAVISNLVSPKAQTSAVAQSFFSGIGNDIGVASSPVTGANITYNLGYPSNNGYSSAFGG